MHIEYTIPHPTWFQSICQNDMKALREMAFDPNGIHHNVRFLAPLYYAVKAGSIEVVRLLLATGAQVFASDILNLREWCPHECPARLSYGCCVIQCLIQHAHDLPPRLCARGIRRRLSAGETSREVFRASGRRLARSHSASCAGAHVQRRVLIKKYARVCSASASVLCQCDTGRSWAV